MHQRLVAILLFLFLAANAVSWPVLPYHAHAADLIFLPLALAILVLPGARVTWHWSDLAVGAYLLGALPSVVTSPDQRQSVLELSREVYLALIYVVFAIATERGFARTIGAGLTLGGTWLSLAGLIFIAAQRISAASWPLMGEVMSLPYLGNTVRLRALTDSEAMLACVLTASIPFAIDRWRTDRARIWSVLAALMLIAALFTFSHAVAGVAVAALIAAWPSLPSRTWIRKAALAAVILIVLAFNFAATVSIRSLIYANTSYADQSQYHYGVDERSTQVGSATITYTVMSYARLKQVAWRTFVESPLTGIGLDQFPSATRRAHNEGSLPAIYSEVDPHTALLGRMAECGAIGGLTLVMLWIAWARLAIDGARGRRGVGFAAAAALAGLMVSSLNADIMNFRFLWVLAGLLRGLHDASGIVTASGRMTEGDAGTR
jgi:hypothetical protein